MSDQEQRQDPGGGLAQDDGQGRRDILCTSASTSALPAPCPAPEGRERGTSALPSRCPSQCPGYFQGPEGVEREASKAPQAPVPLLQVTFA